ncbi:glycoside hydrolase family 78 protein (bacterial alpha-L-rhamnosidase domain-containing protein) [Phlyctema vagabunda]|uniref:Glycoside hydrolase family 78 protein (Bacterial alpha-L-rhamnosidase domain-containing protein) n=1 Tax=Phlyctema vagabunda TaxID=108571 RepID=A0ABR4PDW2_9HELO
MKYAMNNSTNNWDAEVGAFKDSDNDASVHPQDGNSFAIMYNATSQARAESISLELTNNWTPIGSVSPELPGTITGCTSSLEVNAHLAAYQSTRALDLIRLSWGWYLNNPKGTNSTFIEGYLADGTFGYRATSGYEGDYSYTSHAHGWSSGPTYALSTYVVGIKLIAPGGKLWNLEPQFGDLKFAEGGFGTPLGKFWAGWKLVDGGYTYSFGTPSTTAGKLVLPVQNSLTKLVLDGVEVVGTFDAGRNVVFIDCEGGEHELSITY